MPDKTKQCPHCYEPIDAAATSCPHCGRDVPAPKRSLRKTIMFALVGSVGALILICVGLAGIGSLLQNDDTPADPAINQLGAATAAPAEEKAEPTAEPTQTDTPAPTDTPTVTSTPVPSGEIASTTGLYRGPGQNYGSAGTIGAGATVEILSISPDGQWAEISNRNSVSWVPLSVLSNVVNMEAVLLAVDIPPSPTSPPTNTPWPTSTTGPTNTPRPTATLRPVNTAPPAPTQAPVTNTPAPQPTAPPAPAEADVNIINVNKRDEYVDIRNDGGQAQDLNGWNLVSERGNQGCALYGSIQPGQIIRIYALASDAGLGGINCGHGSPIWNNSEPDPAVLYNAQGQEVDRYP